MMTVTSHRFAIILLFPLLAGALLIGCKGAKQSPPSSSYDFTLQDLNGREVSFSEYQGKVIMVNFWAPWCGPCRVETPDLIDLFEQYNGQGLQILGVAVAFRGQQSVRDFTQQYGINYPVLLGNDKVVKQYGGFRGIPTTFIFTRDGRLFRKYEGMRPRNVFEQAVKALL